MTRNSAAIAWALAATVALALRARLTFGNIVNLTMGDGTTQVAWLSVSGVARSLDDT